jgi:hypothetical protein
MPKYEYMLHTWGGFYNAEHAAKHGLKGGYFWFDTAKERDDYLKNLQAIEKRLSAHALAFTTSEGDNTRLRTVAEMTLIHDWKSYDFEYDFGYAFDHESARFMFTNGNYSCDCNLSSFLRRKHPEFPELSCGVTIEICGLEIVSVDG